MLPGACGSYFAAPTSTLGLTADQVTALQTNADSQLLDFVSGVALTASKILSAVQPAGNC